MSLVAGVFSVVAMAQQAPKTPVFKSRIDSGRTDVAVIDNRTGKPVPGLTARDFTVTENGVRQTISTFVEELTSPSIARM